MRRPTSEELAAAAGRSIPDVIAPNLRLLLVGINPGLYSGATGYHFARPGNRFWPALHGAGFTPRLFAPDEVSDLLALGLGITNLVERTTATAAELGREELRDGASRLASKVERWTPGVVAILGVAAYRAAFDRPKAGLGHQPDDIGGRPASVLPNPSGANANYQLPDLIELYGSLRAAIDSVVLPVPAPLHDGR